ncbi:MAG: M48 family metalloprotease [Alphaproteobacteria bacterium]|nr:M48 family metalloprotease [Alphaproteobacteria bacterium]
MSNSSPMRLKARKLARSCGTAACCLAFLALQTEQASAQEIRLLRDTETERLLKSYEDPIAKADGLDPSAVKVYLVDDPTVNSFVAEGQNIFIQTGMIMYAKTANELIGVLAHETGHIKGGHLSRDSSAIAKASVPMILSMIAGLAAMIAGAGQAGMAVMMAGQQIAQGEFNAFSRVQEATADQIALKSLNATHQSAEGMLHVFQRFAAEEAMSAYKIPAFAVDHPIGQDRVALLESLVEASPYKDVKDSPAATHAYAMMQSKLAGFILPIKEVFNRYPVSDTTEPARYARAMAYSRKPDLKLALAEIKDLIHDEPNNPYFYEVLGQIYVNMARPELGIPAFQKSVDLMPSAPQLRVGLAAAELATEKVSYAKPALANLKAALLVENDDVFAWYQTAQAYSDLNNQPMADLSTAEQMYAMGAYPQAARFARKAQGALPQGSRDWERAGDIMAVASIGKKSQEQ